MNRKVFGLALHSSDVLRCHKGAFLSILPKDQNPSFSLGLHIFAWGGVLVLVLPLIWINHRYQGQNVWQNWVESNEFRKPIYTEAIHAADLFRTQANTWSNLAYVLVGLYCIALGLRDRRNTSATNRNYAGGAIRARHLL